MDKRTKVSLVKAKDRREGVRQSIALLGINPVSGKKVVLKPNFNTADPYPGSTHGDTLRELLLYLQEMGADKITVGERSGPPKTAQVIEQLGIFRMAEGLGVDVINFDELPPEELVKVDAPGSHWNNGFHVRSGNTLGRVLAITWATDSKRPSRSGVISCLEKLL